MKDDIDMPGKSTSPLLYIHIGMFKTGTSALQLSSCRHRQGLLEQGIYYPLPVPHLSHRHRDIAMAMTKKNAEKILGEFFSNLTCDLKTNGAREIVLSAEEFSIALLENSANPDNNPNVNLAILNKLKSQIPSEMQTKIVVYIRRQDLFFESCYNQWVKSFDFSNDIRSFIESREHFGNYFSLIEQWSQVFGKQNMLVRVYEKSQMPEGTVADFMRKVLQLDEAFVKSVLENENPDINPRLPRDILEYKRLFNGLKGVTADEKNRYKEHFSQIARQGMYKDRHNRYLEFEERLSLLAKYARGNTQIAQEYLGRPDGQLFLAPELEDREFECYPGLKLEKVAEIGWQLNRLDAAYIQSHLPNLQTPAGRATKFFNKSPFLSWIKKLRDQRAAAAVIKDRECIAQSGLFDRAYYLNIHEDVAEAQIDPLEHYCQAGWKEGRNPSLKFDTQGYLAANPDVAAANINPLLHYIRYGKAEKRSTYQFVDDILL